MKTLKTLIFSAAIGMLFMACDPNYVTTFLLKNSTIDTLSVEFYREGRVDSEKTILPNSTTVLLHTSYMAPVWPDLGLLDSIRVSRNARYILFHRDSLLKSEIYNIEENWRREKHGRHTYSYTFEFTEECFNWLMLPAAPG